METLFERKEKAKLEEAKNCIINIIDSYCPTSLCNEMTGYEWAKILR